MANKTKIESLQELIKNSIGGEVVEQKVELLLPPGENFGSVMYKADFKVKKDEKVGEYHAVAKCPPLNPYTQELFNIQVTFKSEIAWYTTIIPTLKEFQKNHGAEKEIDFFQPFYGSRISLDPKSEKVDLDGVILTQNLTYLGYHNVDRYVGFDLPTSYSILRDLATLHAVTLAYRSQNRDIFDKKIKSYFRTFDSLDNVTMEGFQKPVLTILEKIPEYQPIMEKIKKVVQEADIFGSRALREPWVSILHLDFWINNIMVTGGPDPKVMILDLQSPSIGPPASDLIFFLLTSVKLDIIKEKFDDFIKFYHKNFIKSLQDIQFRIEEFTLKEFLEEIGREARTELVHALSHTYYIFEEKGKSKFDSSDENFKKEDFVTNEIFVNERHIEKYRWIVSEGFKRNWI